jgi:hypothetical protein
MAVAGLTLHTRASGERMTFRTTAADSDGGLVAIGLELPPRGPRTRRPEGPPAPGGAFRGRCGDEALPERAQASHPLALARRSWFPPVCGTTSRMPQIPTR